MAGPDGTVSTTTAAAVFDRLATRKLIVVSGKGGVGRTTMAALLGIALADRGRRVLVATTGHDDRLAWMVGADSLTDEAQPVTDRLYVQRLVPQRCIQEYGGIVLRSARLSTAVFDNRVVRRLLRAIPGLDDFAVVGKAWHEAVRGGDYDVVVFDGPATGHLLYALGVPLAILHAVPRGPLTREAERMQADFENDAVTQAVLVGLPEKWPLTELGELGAQLSEGLRMNVASVLVNAVWPSNVPPLSPPSPSVDPDQAIAPVFETVSAIGRVGNRHRDALHAWRSSEAARRCGTDSVLVVPWQWDGLVDLAALRQLLGWLERSEALHPPQEASA